MRYQVYCVCAGWYCVGCEQYKDEEEMAPGHVCPLHRAPCQERREENYFFALSRYQRQVEVGYIATCNVLYCKRTQVWCALGPVWCALGVLAMLPRSKALCWASHVC